MMVWVPLVFCMRDGVSLCGSAFLRSRPPLFLARHSTPVVSDPMRIVWKGYRESRSCKTANGWCAVIGNVDFLRFCVLEDSMV